MKAGALGLYEEALGTAGAGLLLRTACGRTLPLQVGRWCGPPDLADEDLLRRCRGPVLDIGCGNGALLLQLGGRVARGVGVDASAGMIERARRRAAGRGNLEFVQVTEPRLPFPDASFDVVTSLLSFRYLDWDPVTMEPLGTDAVGP